MARDAGRAGAGGRGAACPAPASSRRRGSTSPRTCLRRRDEAPDAIVFWGESRVRRRAPHPRQAVRRGLAPRAGAERPRACGPGDRVAGFLPNLPEAVIGMLAAASLGAVWSSCSPRLRRARACWTASARSSPRCCFAADGYHYGGQAVRFRGSGSGGVRRAAAQRQSGWWWCPTSSERPDAAPGARQGRSTSAEFLAPYSPPADIAFAPPAVRPPALHPLLLRHHGRAQVHRPRRRRHAAAAPQGASVARRRAARRPPVLFHHLRLDDVELARLGARLGRDAHALRRLAVPSGGQRAVRLHRRRGHHPLRHLGQVHRRRRQGWGSNARETHRLASLRAILSTGSPLVPEAFDYVYREVQARRAARFDLGRHRHRLLLRARLPVAARAARRDPVQGPRHEGGGVRRRRPRDRTGEKGELVCTAPFPSMPVGFWNDPDGAKYRAAYFERFPGVWCHGDYVEATRRTAGSSFTAGPTRC
ncbi:MAG: hypothetical protein KatS3mg123_2233 [Burkholderiales bacterium]|nr:MAG: hypothetical protein KatS3mg123_2233 [Burkholderiales bacterium]